MKLSDVIAGVAAFYEIRLERTGGRWILYGVENTWHCRNLEEVVETIELEGPANRQRAENLRLIGREGSPFA